MSPSPASNSSSITNHSPEKFRIVRKRNRIPLSCGPCRHRKLKCNRQHPCENCVKRNDVDSCQYAAPPSKSRRHLTGGEKSTDDMQSRIDRLEGLVLSLMGAGPGAVPKDGKGASSIDEDEDSESEESHDEEMIKEEPEDEVEDVRSALGFMKVDKGKSMYRADSAWSVLLNEFAEVKNYFATHKAVFDELLAKQQQSEQSKFGKTAFPFAAAPAIPKDEILKLLPSKEVTDLLVENWVEGFDHSYHIIHGPTFRVEYDDFWKDPSKADTLWTGLLFAIMMIATQGLEKSGMLPMYDLLKDASSEKFRYATEQCLVAGQFTEKLTQHNMQCLIVYMLGIRKDAVDQTWLFLGLVCRIALAMGLHRDTRKFNVDISPYQVEIRKRLWNILMCMDLLFSIKIGLPCIIRTSECDAPMPTNLHDFEFDMNTTKMPPSRDLNEQTPMSYMIAKTYMAFAFGKVVAATNTISSGPSYEYIFEMEKDLRDAYAKVPEFLRFRSMEESKNDHPWLIIQRFTLDILYQRSILILHRPYATYRARCNSKYNRSRRAVLEASMKLLSHQAALFEAQKGPLKEAKWAIESLSAQDYNSAVMILCVELRHSAKEDAEQYDSFSLSVSDCRKMLRAVERAESIFAYQKDNYEMAKIYTVLKFALEAIREMFKNSSRFQSDFAPDVGGPSPPDQFSDSSPSALTSISTNDSSTTSDALRSEHSAAMTLGMMSGGALSPNMQSSYLKPPDLGPSILDGVSSAPNFPMLTPGGSLPFSYFTGGSVMDTATNNEWDEWDTFLKGINLDPSVSTWGNVAPDSAGAFADGGAGNPPFGMSGNAQAPFSNGSEDPSAVRT